MEPVKADISPAVREEFVDYVRDITSFQRDEIATRVEKIAHHQVRSWHYFFGCQFAALGGLMACLKMWGPRNITQESMFLLRPMGPAMGIGMIFYGVAYNSRLYMMKLRVWALIEDFEYEIKRAKAHHVPEGALHLAWLTFVMEQIKTDKTPHINIASLRRPPKPLELLDKNKQQ